MIPLYRLIFCAAALASALHVAVAADEPALPKTLSIEDAVLLGLRNNHELRVQQLEPVVAGAFERIERGVFDPELFGAVSFSEESASETDRATGQQFAVEGRDADAVVGLRQRIPVGTELELSVGTDRNISNRSPEQQRARFGLTVTQQLLRGFGPAVGLARLRQASLDTLASQSELRGFAEAFVADVEAAYWRLFLATESIRVVEESLALAEAQLEDVLSRIEVGQLSEFEAAAAGADVAQRKQDLIDAESLLQVRRLELMRRIYPDLPVHGAFELLPSTKPDVRLIEASEVSERVSLALQSRPEIKEAEYQVRRGELETVVTRNRRLPRLELFVNLGKTGFANTLRETFRATDGPDFDATVGLEFSQFIGNRAERARDTISRANLEQAEEALANLRTLVRQDVLLALNELQRAQKQIAASAETRRFRKQIFEAEQDRFEVGQSTALEVSRTQRDLVESQIAEIEARVAYQLAKIELYFAEGSLLERRGLVAEWLGN